MLDPRARSSRIPSMTDPAAPPRCSSRSNPSYAANQLTDICIEIVQLVRLREPDDIRYVDWRHVVHDRHDLLPEPQRGAELNQHPLAWDRLRAEEDGELLTVRQLREDGLGDAVPALDVP